MVSLERCKACGLVMKKSKKYKLCPACGVTRKGFEDYTDRVNEKRRFILELHLHPILLHFPQAIAVIITFCILAGKAVPALNGYFWSTVTVLAYLLPLSALAAYISGIIDGKMRFKRMHASYLYMKMIAGSLFIIFSCAIAGIIHSGMVCSEWYVLTLSAGCVLCQAFLARIGIKLMFAELPG